MSSSGLKPMTEIARQVGLRDQDVARTCDGAEIVRPRVGHWQKVCMEIRGSTGAENDQFAAGDFHRNRCVRLVDIPAAARLHGEARSSGTVHSDERD